MDTMRRALVAAAVLAGTLGASGCAQMQVDATGQQVRLWGSNEVPPVTTQAYGTGVVNIGTDRSVTVTLSVVDMAPTAAHIHEGAAGKNGPVIIPLTKSGDTYTVPAGTKLSATQLNEFKAGNLYVNVHSDANKGGEIRAQLKP